MTAHPDDEIHLSEERPEAVAPDGAVYRFTYTPLDDPAGEQPEEPRDGDA